MKSIKATVEICAPIEQVFDAICDHQTFLSGGRIESCQIVREGREVRNGLGCIRQVKAPSIWYEEEITRFERPTRFDYLIRKCSLPMQHEGSSLEFGKSSQGTQVLWTARFKVSVFLLGPLLTYVMRRMLTKEFERLLLQAKEKLESH
jgi:hypothetical protein